MHGHMNVRLDEISFQINQPTRCNSFTSLLTVVYVWINMFRALPRPSSGVYNWISGLWFYSWSVAVAGYNLPDHDQQHCYRHAPTVKPEASNAILSSWWRGEKAPETCWFTHKRQLINLWNCCILLVDLFESYDNARFYEHQKRDLVLHKIEDIIKKN
jgi:hypothetical protein